MRSPEDLPGGISFSLYEDQWFFSVQALDALRAIMPIAAATLSFCAINLSQVIDDFDQYFEIEYFEVPLRGERIDGIIRIDSF